MGMLSYEQDATVPAIDEGYLHKLARGIVKVATEACRNVRCDMADIELPLCDLPSTVQAKTDLHEAHNRWQHYCQPDATQVAVHTAERDWFGAQETLSQTRAHQEGRLLEVAQRCLQVEILIVGIAPWTFIDWPGKVFTEYALIIKQRYPEVFVITQANGELQGYLVTTEAVQNKSYEASNALFRSTDSAQLLVPTSFELLKKSRVTAKS